MIWDLFICVRGWALHRLLFCLILCVVRTCTFGKIRDEARWSWHKLLLNYTVCNCSYCATCNVCLDLRCINIQACDATSACYCCKCRKICIYFRNVMHSDASVSSVAPSNNSTPLAACTSASISSPDLQIPNTPTGASTPSDVETTPGLGVRRGYWPVRYQLPILTKPVLDALNRKDLAFIDDSRSGLRNQLIQTLFEDVNMYTWWLHFINFSNIKLSVINWNRKGFGFGLEKIELLLFSIRY